MRVRFWGTRGSMPVSPRVQFVVLQFSGKPIRLGSGSSQFEYQPGPR